MISVISNHLKAKDLAMVRKYARFVLDRFVRTGLQRKSKINIKILGAEEIKDAADLLDLKEYKAWCTYDGIDETGCKRFTVIIDHKRLNKNGKKPITRLKNLLIDLGHELVHVKQYINGEMFDYKNGDVRHKGIIFASTYMEDEEVYYDSPWEIEAYGREYGLYKMFCSQLKQERLSS